MVFDKEQYELLDFGNGRKLEQFGGTIVDRPSPSATDAERASPALWKRATARFERGTNQGKWQWNSPRPAVWKK